MGFLNPLDRHACPDAEFSNEEWEAARQHLVQERLDLGWDRENAEARIDDLMVAEQCVQNRDDLASVQADEERARRKENW